MSDSEEVKFENIEDSFLIKVLHISDDESSKTFGEILKTKSSRNLMQALREKQMYVNQMHKEEDMRVSLVTHHLNKLIQLGFLNIIEKPISKKTKDHRYFDLKHDAYLILVDKEEGVEEVHKYGILKKIFKDSVKLSGVAIAGAATWISTNLTFSSSLKRLDDSLSDYELMLPLIITGLVIGLGLTVIYYSKKQK